MESKLDTKLDVALWEDMKIDTEVPPIWPLPMPDEAMALTNVGTGRAPATGLHQHLARGASHTALGLGRYENRERPPGFTGNI